MNSNPDYKALYEAKCAEAEKMRGAARKAYFALMEWDAPIQDTRILGLLREMYEVCSHAEAGKPLLDKMVELRQENQRLRDCLMGQRYINDSRR